MKFFKEIQQPVTEATRPDAYQRDEINATSGFGKNSYAYQMDGGANDEDHEGDRRREQQVQSGTWYVRINGKIVKDKQGQPYTFNGKAAANKAALTMQAKPFNQGKEIMLTTNPNDKVAEGWKEEAQDLEDWSKEVNMRLYRAHESQRPALARQLSKLEQKHFGSEFTHPNLTNIVWSALRALQKGDMVHYDSERVGQMPFGSAVGDDAKLIAQYSITRDELAGYRMLHDKGMVDNLEQFLKLRRLVRAKSWPIAYYEELEQLSPEEAWLKMANDLNWSKDSTNEAVQAKTDDNLQAYYAQRKAEAEKKKKEQGVTEDQTGMYYSEELAQKVFDQNPNLDATGRADAVLDAGWPIAVADLGKKSAQRKFAYDEDFPSDFVSMYYQLQKQSKQGVAEGVAETLPLNDALKLLRQYGADHFKTTTNELHFYKNGQPFSVDLVLNPDTTRSVTLSSLNSATRSLKGQGVSESTLSESDSPVAGAITRRILQQRHDLLSTYGPVKVMAAIDDVADFVGDTEEIGSSDVSSWVKQVEQTLAGMGEGIEEDTISQMRDYFNQDSDSVDVSREYGNPIRKKPPVGIPPGIQALVNKMYHNGKITQQEFQILKNFQKKTKINVGVQEADTSTGNAGYDSMLAVMKAVDAGQDATFNLGGEPITLDYNEARFLAGRYKAFLKAGRQEEFLKYMENPEAFDHLMKQLRDLMDKQKNFKGSVEGERGVEEDAPAVAKMAGGLGLGLVAAAGAPAIVGILGPLLGIPFAAYGAYSAAKIGMKGVEKLWDMAAEKLGGDDKVEQYTKSKIAALPPEEAKAAAAVVNNISESRKPLPEVNENEYWCQIDSMAKPIPEGYRRTANGYITRI